MAGAAASGRTGAGRRALRFVAFAVTLLATSAAAGCRAREDGATARDGGSRDAIAAETTNPGAAPRSPATRDALGAGLSPAESLEPEEPSPPPSSPDLDRRMRHLVEAIAQDDARLAQDVLLPREAYIALRDVTDPARAFDTKLAAAFKAQVHRQHKKTHGIEAASFTRFELGSQLTKAPAKRRDMKRGTWRARHARLTYSVNGKPHHVDVRELVAWRGNWYVLRLR